MGSKISICQGVKMSSEKFNLARNEFESCSSLTLKELRNDNHFTDVTLACEDGKQIKAHKVLLSSSSNFFQDILINNPHQHPLLYLKGIKSSELENIIDFIYIGQTQVGQKDLEKFMQAANELKIKGLIETLSDEKLSDVNDYKDEMFSGFIPEFPNNSKSMKIRGGEKKETNQSSIRAKTNKYEQFGLHESVENYPVDFHQSTGFHQSDQYLSDFHQSDQYLSDFHQSDQYATGKFPCDRCEYSTQFTQNLIKHKQAKHEGVRYPCTECEYKSTQKQNLSRHILKVHGSNVMIHK